MKPNLRFVNLNYLTNYISSSGGGGDWLPNATRTTESYVAVKSANSYDIVSGGSCFDNLEVRLVGG